MAKSEDPDQTPHSAASDLDLHGFFKHFCSNPQRKYGNVQCSPKII